MITTVTKGWLQDKNMPANVKSAVGKARSFSDVHEKFLKMAAPKAQVGTDYDIPNEPPVYDQGDMGSCVLNATCGAVNILLAVEGLTTAMLSRLFLYYLCREVMGTTDQDSGTYTHLAVDRIGNIGACNENLWAYSDANLLIPPPPETYPEAKDNTVTAWFNIDAQGADRLTQMETAIRSNHPIIYGSPVSAALENYQAGQVLTTPASNQIIGGHSTCFTGVHYIGGQRVWRVRNSWSALWGDNGHFLIDDAWASWSDLTDLWVVSRVDPLLF
jgi:C1A family cysteine protease